MELGVTTFTPFVSKTISREPPATISGRALLELIFDIEFRMQQLRFEDEKPEHCWHRMFQNPVMAAGPIPSKGHPGLGLEMPLNMIFSLIRSDRACKIDGRLFIKGLSTTVIATNIARYIG